MLLETGSLFLLCHPWHGLVPSCFQDGLDSDFIVQGKDRDGELITSPSESSPGYCINGTV